LYYHNYVKGDNAQKEYYKKYSNKLNRVKEESKRMYYKNKIASTKNNTKETWNIINQIIKIKSKTSYTPDKIIKNDVEITQPQEIANHFNEHFRDSRNVPSASKHFTDYLRPNLSPSESFFINPTSPEEIHSLICSLDSNKSPGPFGIPIKLIKMAAPYICDPLCNIFNGSFSTGIVPDDLKLSKIIPLYKNESIYDLNNYRPISILSPFSKILEKIMYTRLLSFLDKNKTLYEYQFGFRKKHSTSLAILEIVDNLLHALDNGLFTCGVFIDFSKAFDTIDHNILLSKLAHYGVRGISHDWFRSYISNRLQFVEINGIRSNLIQLITGIPQGSNLGPLLFLLYVNDIANSSQLLSFRLFADDTNLFIEDKNITSLVQNTNHELEKFSEWIKVNKLSLNMKKSKFMIISSSRKKYFANTDIRLNNTLMEKTDSIKYLGVLIDHHLTWGNHINMVCKKISKNIGIISKVRHYVDLETLKLIYYSLIYPYLQYGAITWGNTYKTRLNHLNVLNNKVIRIMTYSHYLTHCPPLYKELNILQLNDIVFIQIALFMYDYFNNNLPSAFHKYFTSVSEIHSHNTRFSHLNFHASTVHTNFGKFSLTFQGPKIWRSINNKYKLLSRNLFTKSLKKDCLDSYD